MFSFTPFPFLRYAMALILGITCYLLLDCYRFVFWVIPAVTLVFYAGLYRLRRHYQWAWSAGIVGLLFLVEIGYLLTGLHVGYNDSRHYIHAGRFSHYEVVIASIIEQKDKSWKTTGEVKNVLVNQCQPVPKIGKVLLYFDKHTCEKPNYGDVLLVKGMPHLVPPPKNPDEFDYRRYLSTQNVYFQHYLRDSDYTKTSKVVPNRLMKWAVQVNTFSDSLLTTYLGSKQEYAVANAMILGLRDDLDNDLVQAYSAAGAIHVLSVSGLHVGVIYIVLVGLLGWLKRSHKRYGTALFVLVILGVLWFYALVTGLSSPVLRSTSMFSLITIAENVARKHNSYNTVAFSAFLLLLWNPFFLINVGFQLSYLAVFGMIYFQPMLNPLVIIDKNKNLLYWIGDRLWKVSTVAVAAQIATLPITIYYFHQFPNYFLLANPIVILLSSFALISGLTFLVIASLAIWVGGAIILPYLAFILKWLIWLLNWSVLFTESLPYSITPWLHIHTWEVFCLYALILMIALLIETRKFVFVKTSIASLSILVCFNVYEKFAQQNQSLLVIHAVPKHSVLSVIEGTKASLIADTAFLNSRKDIGFRLNNFLSQRGITTLAKVDIGSLDTEGGRIMTWRGKSLLLIDQPLKSHSITSTNVFDYVIVANKSVRHIEQLAGLRFKRLVVDGSYSAFYTKQLLAQAEQHKMYPYSVMTSGALVLKN